MPWYEFRCESCSAAVRRKVPVAHRGATLVHRVDGCEHGRLRRVAPLQGPADGPVAPCSASREHVSATPGRPATNAPDLHQAPRGSILPSASLPATPPPSDLSRALQAICTVTDGEAGREVAASLVGVLPSLSERLSFLELASPGDDAGARDLRDDLAAAVANATPRSLARERRLLDLLLLARCRGRLGVSEVDAMLRDDDVAMRLLASALRWAPQAAGEAAPAPPRLAWNELLRLVDRTALRERVQHLAAHAPAAADVWERVAAKLAAREIEDAPGTQPDAGDAKAPAA